MFSDMVMKLAIIRCLVDVLAEWEPSITDGIEAEVTMTDGVAYELIVKRKRSPDRPARRVPVSKNLK